MLRGGRSGPSSTKLGAAAYASGKAALVGGAVMNDAGALGMARTEQQAEQKLHFASTPAS